MTAVFGPADGQRARWRYCYDLVLKRTPGDEITYREVMELLDVEQRVAVAAMREAQKHLEENRKFLLRNVRRYGWIVLDAPGNLDQIEHARRKAARATTRAARKIVATPRDQLSKIEQSRLDFETRHVLAARDLYARRSRSFSELESAERGRQRVELPSRRDEAS